MDTGKTGQPKTGNNDLKERPDFEKEAQEYINACYAGYIPPPFKLLQPSKAGFIAGANHGYDLSRKRIEELEKQVELFGIRDEKREVRFSNTNKENGRLYARIEELEAELLSIRNKFVDMMPSGQTNAWDWVTFSKNFLTWHNKQLYKFITKK